MKTPVAAILMSILTVGSAWAAEGMISVPSAYSVEESSNRAVRILNGKGMTVFSRIPHSANAAKAGVELRDTELIIFGNPKVGSPLMRCRQSVGIDLPQKFLIWQDEHHQVWISYNDPRYLVRRHSIEGCEEILEKIEKALGGIAGAVAREP